LREIPELLALYRDLVKDFNPTVLTEFLVSRDILKPGQAVEDQPAWAAVAALAEGKSDDFRAAIAMFSGLN
jgi:hypothetical protein